MNLLNVEPYYFMEINQQQFQNFFALYIKQNILTTNLMYQKRGYFSVYVVEFNLVNHIFTANSIIEYLLSSSKSMEVCINISQDFKTTNTCRRKNKPQEAQTKCRNSEYNQIYNQKKELGAGSLGAMSYKPMKEFEFQTHLISMASRERLREMLILFASVKH